MERGKEETLEDYNQMKDELKYGHSRNEMMNSLSDDTLTFRNTLDSKALPIREPEKFEDRNKYWRWRESLGSTMSSLPTL